MARASIDSIRAAIFLALKSSTYRAKLDTEFERIMTEKLENNGADIISGGGNGINFGVSQSNPEYSADIYLVLKHLADGTWPTTRTLGRTV